MNRYLLFALGLGVCAIAVPVFAVGWARPSNCNCQSAPVQTFYVPVAAQNQTYYPPVSQPATQQTTSYYPLVSQPTAYSYTAPAAAAYQQCATTCYTPTTCYKPVTCCYQAPVCYKPVTCCYTAPTCCAPSTCYARPCPSRHPILHNIRARRAERRAARNGCCCP